MPFRLAMASNSSASNTREISSESKETALMIGIVNLLVGIIAVVGNSALCLTIYQDPFSTSEEHGKLFGGKFGNCGLTHRLDNRAFICSL